MLPLKVLATLSTKDTHYTKPSDTLLNDLTNLALNIYNP